MAVLVEAAKKKVKIGADAPAWRLTVGGGDLSDRLIELEATFSASGESGMTFRVAAPLYRRSREREFVNLEIGYGPTLVPFFLGRLSKPKDARSGLYSDATAYGPSGDLGGRYFGSRVSYANMDASVAALDVWNRCFSGENSSALFQWDAPTDTLEGEMEQFGFEHSFLEALQACLEPLGLVGCDQLAGAFRVVQPLRMDLLNRGNLQGVFGEGAYSAEPGFGFGESSRNIYNSVIVARRNEGYAGGSGTGQASGSPDPAEYAVWAQRPVLENGQVPAFQRRADIIPDYPGTQAGAERLAEHRAASHSVGIGTAEVEVAPCDFALYDVVGFERTERVLASPTDPTGPEYNVLYALSVQDITLRIAAGPPSVFRMTLSGSAAERERTLLTPGGSGITLGLSGSVAA